MATILGGVDYHMHGTTLELNRHDLLDAHGCHAARRPKQIRPPALLGQRRHPKQKQTILAESKRRELSSHRTHTADECEPSFGRQRPRARAGVPFGPYVAASVLVNAPMSLVWAIAGASCKTLAEALAVRPGAAWAPWLPVAAAVVALPLLAAARRRRGEVGRRSGSERSGVGVG